VRAILVTILLVVVAGAAAFALLSNKGPAKPHFTVALDNAFGITTGADLKVAGVRAGKIKAIRLDQKSHKALIDFEITQDGFGSLRKDVFCESRPQSLIGEYYVDCKPGTSEQKLPVGATIPVEQTASTIPLDLVNNVLRRPYRERLGIILDELGVGVAGRADEINEVVRRASPALRETDKVLVKLGKQNETLKQLVTDADTVLGDLADNRKDVGRWVVETKETAAASAERRDAIAAGLRRLPTFLRELRPTIAELGDASEANVPALQNLDASANQLATFLENLKPLSESTQENLVSLADASRKGRPAVKAARPVVAELNAGTAKLPELANNAAIVLEHLDDRKHAVEKDPRSPGGQGYTGFEAPLQWLYDQSMAINTYDKNGYILKINLFTSKCSDYQNPKSLKEEMAKDPSFYKDCAAVLGPNQPSITTPDPTSTGRQFASSAPNRAQAREKAAKKPETKAKPPTEQVPEKAPQTWTERKDPVDEVTRQLPVKELRKRAIQRLQEAIRKGTGDVEKLRQRLEDRLGIQLPKLEDIRKLPKAPTNPQVPTPSFPTPQLPTPSVPDPPTPKLPTDDVTGPLLDYLFAP